METKAKGVYQKLLEIQKEVDSFVKDKKGHNYDYATGNQVLGKIRPLMNILGLLLKQEVVEINNTPITYVNSKGYDKTEVLTSAIQRFTWVDVETGQSDVNMFAGNGFNDFEKGLGSALTYAERYFLLKFFHVPTDADDPDTRQTSEVVKQVSDKPWLNKGTDKFNATKDKLKSGEVTLQTIKQHFKLSKEVETLLQS